MPETTKIHLLDLMPEQLTAELAKLHMPHFRTKQIHEWVFEKRIGAFEQMTNISLYERKLLDEHFTIFTSEELRKLTATDGTEKILLRWPAVQLSSGALHKLKNTTPENAGEEETTSAPPTGDVALPVLSAPAPTAEAGTEPATTLTGLTETVMIPCDDDQCDEYGNTTMAHRRTACLSTQVGCPVRCKFCASGMEGLQGQLTAGQIVEQALRLLYAMPAERRLTNIVFMGMGEPLANFGPTVQAVRTLMAPWAFGISARKITVSTVGLPPQMKRLADLQIPITLAISLHAPNDELRRKIIPWANRISIDQIVDAGRYYFDKTGRELTLEYIMLDGVNTLPEHARQLAGIAKLLRANVNLIYFNEVPELDFRRPNGATVFGFQNTLRAQHVNCHIRRSRGREIAAACGQLARQETTIQE